MDRWSTDEELAAGIPISLAAEHLESAARLPRRDCGCGCGVCWELFISVNTVKIYSGMDTISWGSYRMVDRDVVDVTCRIVESRNGLM
jgi:hypothetical protein